MSSTGNIDLKKRNETGVSNTLDTPLLDGVKSSADMKDLGTEDLQQLVDEVRQETVRLASITGGHLGAGLGVVELTVALHHVFDTPTDKLIWDVGHQCYPHKILTGRRDKMTTLRKGGGLSGFTNRSESEYDPFGTGHSSTSISAGLGMAVANELAGRDTRVIAVIGDGAMSAGQAYEAMNNAGAMDARLIVILNDNDMSIARPVGAMSAYLSRMVSSAPYRSMRDLAKGVVKKLPKSIEEAARKAEEYTRGFITGGTLFEEMGFYYVGPVNGHNLSHLLPVLKNLRDDPVKGPILLHVRTEKGHGYAPAEKASDKLHGVGRFDVVTGAPLAAAGGANAPAYTRVFSDHLIEAAETDDKIVAITAAMPSGTGLDAFMERFPDRCFDVGIAEQHAVTFAAGLAAEGYKPFCAIYSTFLQRAYDQVIHDVAIQGLPVRFMLDRAGLVGADGATHQGAFDLAYLGCLPGMVVMAPADEAELCHMVTTAAAYDTGPSVVRFPRGAGVGVSLPERAEELAIGRGRVVREGTGVALLSIGTRLADCLDGAERLSTRGINASVADARFLKPLDRDLVLDLAAKHEVLVTVEEGASGGFGAAVLACLADGGVLDAGLKIRCLTLPDVFVEHDSQESQIHTAGLDGEAIAKTVLGILGIDEAASSQTGL